jgi:hypothetical protein
MEHKVGKSKVLKVFDFLVFYILTLNFQTSDPQTAKRHDRMTA